MDSCFHQFGSTIINGAITSFIAGFFLARCQISFLYKFGILMMFTITSSLIISMLFYPALGYFVGPQHRDGDLMYHFINPLRRKFNAFQSRRALQNDMRLTKMLEEVDQDKVPPSTCCLVKRMHPANQLSWARVSSNQQRRLSKTHQTVSGFLSRAVTRGGRKQTLASKQVKDEIQQRRPARSSSTAEQPGCALFDDFSSFS